MAQSTDVTQRPGADEPTQVTTTAAGDTLRDRPYHEQAAPHEHGYAPRKDDYAKRLRRIEGQVRGIARMVDEDVYCIDILTQVSAATKALQAVAMGLVNDHMGHCVVEAARGSDQEAREKIDEIEAVITRLLK